MKKNGMIVFEGRDMYRILIRNKNNRAVSKKDCANNDYLSPTSIKKGETRVRNLVKSITAEGWKNLTIYVYKKDGYYILLDGNTRREALDVCVNTGILSDYPAWYAIDLSCEINPVTGKEYTFDEAQAFVEFANIHAQKAHTATDIFESHAKTGSPACQEICNIAKKFDMSTTIVADLVSGIHGSSKEENVMRVVDMDVDEERLNDVNKILDTLDTVNNNKYEGITKSFTKEAHCIHAFYSVYRFCKMFGVQDEFCDLMKIASTMRKPIPFLRFFDNLQTAAMIDHLLYMVDNNGYFEGACPRQAKKLLATITSALEKGDAMRGISKFHTDFRMKKKNLVFESYYKKAV